MGMQLQIDPGFRLARKVGFAALGGKSFRSMGLNGQINIPAMMTSLVNGSHTAFAKFIRHFILIQDHVSDLPDSRDSRQGLFAARICNHRLRALIRLFNDMPDLCCNSLYLCFRERSRLGYLLLIGLSAKQTL